MTLKEHVDQRGLRIVEIAKRLDKAPSMISMIINGWVKPPKKYQTQLAEILGLTVEEIRSGHVRVKNGGRK